MTSCLTSKWPPPWTLVRPLPAKQCVGGACERGPLRRLGVRARQARAAGAMEEADLLLALRLQLEEDDNQAAQGGGASQRTPPRGCAAPSPGEVLSVVDPSWELLDPSPDIRALFLQFNQLFFWGKLAGVEVKWSPRMTLCAGVCSYEGRGGLCSIRLSGPLLKLRPRKDLVETLLHEMIHALLFVTHNNRDHDAHGDEFCKHMRRINGITGAKISVYHNFHDEVDEYRKHWWLCNGPCQKKRPYFGYVKRAMNRAPSANDPWWAEHKQTCGGTYTKIKEPENYSKKGNGKSNLPATQNPNFPATQKPKLPEDKGNAQGVAVQTIIPFSGKGYKLGQPSTPSLWAKMASPGNIAKPETARQKPESPVNFPQNSASKSPSHIGSNTGNSDGDECIGFKRTKKSVANTKVFKNVNGSPVRIFPVTGNRKTSNPISTKEKQGFSSSMGQKTILFDVTAASSKALSASETSSRSVFPVFGSIKTSGSTPTRFPPSSIAQKRVSVHATETSSKIPSASQGSCSGGSLGQPHKRPKMDNKTALADFFSKPPSSALRVSESSCATNHGNSIADAAVSSVRYSSTSVLSPKVSCPICQADILESEINNHLDSCLTDSFLSEVPIM